MLQQAQEVIVIKSIRDGMSAKEGFHRIISRVVSDYYLNITVVEIIEPSL